MDERRVVPYRRQRVAYDPAKELFMDVIRVFKALRLNIQQPMITFVRFQFRMRKMLRELIWAHSKALHEYDELS